MTELERLQAENEYLRVENAVVKKLKELRLRDEKEQEEKRKLFEDWSQSLPFQQAAKNSIYHQF